MSEEFIGQTIKNGESPDTRQFGEQESYENAISNEKPEFTKSVSNRINEIREKEVEPLRSRVAEYEKQLHGFEKRDIEWQARQKENSTDQMREEMQLEERHKNELINNDPEVIALRQAEFARQKSEVLGMLQENFGEDHITDLDKLPKDFYAMLAVGVNPIKAYAAAREQKHTPPTAGSVQSFGKTVEKEFYTNEELDRLTSKELDNPVILQRAIQSLSRQ